MFSISTIHEIEQKHKKQQNDIARHFLKNCHRLIEIEYEKYQTHMYYTIPAFNPRYPCYNHKIIATKVYKSLRKKKNLKCQMITADMIYIQWKRRERSKEY